MNKDVLYAAISGTVLAIDVQSGKELWRRTVRPGVGVTTIDPRQTRVLVAAAGELWALDAKDGEILWHNPLKGLGLGFLTIAGAPYPAAVTQTNIID